MKGKKKKSILLKNPPLFFLLGYLLIIFAGAILLTLPLSSAKGEWSSFIDCFFVSTSAVCVTGLTPVVTASFWSLFGQWVILLLIQIGGLGIVTAMVAIFSFTGHRFSLKERRMMMEEKGNEQMSGIVRLMRFIIFATLLIELIGAALLSISFIPKFGLGKGIWFGIFHSVSAFCNAGFDIIGEASLAPYGNNAFVLLTISMLIVIAGLGYTVYLDLLDGYRHKRLRFHTRLVLVSTVFLLAIGTLGIYLVERNNPNTLGAMSEPAKWLNAFFQSVTTRTAGFFSFNQAQMREPSAFLSMILMFIGGSPGGIAGGVKTTTVISIIVGIIALVRSAKEAPIFSRNIEAETIRRAMVIFILALAWVAGSTFLMMLVEKDVGMLDIQFEIISAMGTVGLTRDLTPSLSSVSKILLSATMLFGKLGPLTAIYAVTPQKEINPIRTAEEKILVG